MQLSLVVIAVSQNRTAAGSLPDQSELQEFGALQGREIVIRNKRQHDITGRGLVNRKAFHVVDFKPQVGHEDGRTVDDGARLDVTGPDATDLHQQSFQGDCGGAGQGPGRDYQSGEIPGGEDPAGEPG